MRPTIVSSTIFGNSGFITDQTDARGHYTIGKEMVDNVIDKIRRVAGTTAHGR